ncbi:DUF3949 domain-containing protein [Heyndrickxia sp. NPDC080065]|uniref:DUF3949 domain-containing protein n=1 Tax=Heyndrickxia sp. NPDC080065 TaxID=3390568 RepID=UPI003D0433C2
MDIAFIIIISVYVIYCLVMIPFQYNYISSMKDLKKTSNLTHNELYENMSFEKEQMHFNLQGNIMNMPSSLIAMLIYKLRHRRNQ